MTGSAWLSGDRGPPAVRQFVGGDPARVRGEPVVLHGDRCFTAAAGRVRQRLDPARVRVLLDSGAFSDPPERRLSPDAALQRQLRWEARAGGRWGAPCRAHAIVSYDRLVDEKWDGARRRKERWSVAEADAVVRETVEAARYLAAQRARLAPRRLVLACQGVDAAQYAECAAGVLAVARPGDWLGLGGWCVLGRWRRRWLPAFWATLHAVLPRIAAAGIGHVHVFGVLWPPALERVRDLRELGRLPQKGVGARTPVRAVSSPSAFDKPVWPTSMLGNGPPPGGG